MTTERCERCDRPVATSADWAAVVDHECDASDTRSCTWGDDRCWGDRAECEMVGGAIDWRTRARDEARRADAAEALLAALADEFDRAARDKLDRGGMRVPYQGDFSGCTITTAIRMRRWAERIREAIGTVKP
jgi:hypothetical protein